MSLKQRRKLAAAPERKFLKLDLGCGPHPREGFEGVDSRNFGQPWQCDLATTPWRLTRFATMKGQSEAYPVSGVEPLGDGSVEEVHCSHFLEHLTGPQRIHFVNELHRVLVPGGKCMVVTPHWASNRAYGDLTHQWPPVSEMWFYYLNAEWRAANAPHNDFYRCDFEATWGYALHPELTQRNQEYQMHALSFWKEAAQDIIATLTKKIVIKH